MRLQTCSKPAKFRNWYAIKVDEQQQISTVVEITINFKAVLRDPSHYFGLEMYTGIHITKVADELHRAPKTATNFLERRFIRIKLIENVLHMFIERSRRSQPRVQFPSTAWPLFRRPRNSIAFSRYLSAFHTKPARYLVRIETTSDVKVCVPRVQILHG